MMTAARKVAAAGDDHQPVDLDHLARQTMGNRDLEREVLHLFIRQSEICLRRLGEERTDKASVAHVLLGSARGIGARDVAAAAEALETEARAAGAGIEARVREVGRSVAIANAFIREILAAG